MRERERKKERNPIGPAAIVPEEPPFSPEEYDELMAELAWFLRDDQAAAAAADPFRFQ